MVRPNDGTGDSASGLRLMILHILGCQTAAQIAEASVATFGLTVRPRVAESLDGHGTARSGPRFFHREDGRARQRPRIGGSRCRLQAQARSLLTLEGNIF